MSDIIKCIICNNDIMVYEDDNINEWVISVVCLECYKKNMGDNGDKNTIIVEEDSSPEKKTFEECVEERLARELWKE